MRLSEIDNSPISHAVGSYFICKFCHHMDRDGSRIEIGTPCPECGSPSEGGRLVYPYSVMDLLDMMQGALHAKEPFEPYAPDWPPSHGVVSVVLFFCTLREVLLLHFIESMCAAMNIPDAVCERLIRDNGSYSQKQDKLLPTLTGCKWLTMIEELDSAAYRDVAALMKETAIARNEFMHEGLRSPALTRSTAEKCIEAAPVLMDLFCDLHNRYAKPLLQGRQ